MYVTRLSFALDVFTHFHGQIIDRLPLTIETLKASKLGKIVVKLTKDPPAPGEYIPRFNHTKPCARRLASMRVVARVELVRASVV